MRYYVSFWSYVNGHTYRDTIDFLTFELAQEFAQSLAAKNVPVVHDRLLEQLDREALNIA